MRSSRSSSILSSESHSSVYFLGDQSSSSHFLKPYQGLIESFTNQGEFLSIDREPEWTACYDQDSQQLHTRLPLLVFRPASTLSISSFVKACAEAHIPIKSRCGGTSLTGASVAAPEGIILLTNHLKKILVYDKITGFIKVEPGITPHQLNQVVEEDGWHFPLEMASGGVAGLAGCLSCCAKSYHQSDRNIFRSVHSVTLIDGRGEQMKVPSSLICAAEGLFGIFTEIELKLTRKPLSYFYLICQSGWEDLLNKLPVIRRYQALKVCMWQEGVFKMRVEGEAWRTQSTLDSLFSLFPSQISLSKENLIFHPSYQIGHSSFIYLSSALASHQLPAGIDYLQHLAQDYHLKYQIWSDVLGGGLYLFLSSGDNSYSFVKKIEELMILWLDWLERFQGFIISAHGIGKLMRPYLPPFLGEEAIRFLKKMQKAFDPFELFGKDHVFPVPGKSVEKVCYESGN